MQFSEGKHSWQQMPQWVRFLIQFGYDWPRDNSTTRRITVVSLPCDSAAAGLIALGALIRDLGNPKANNIDGHFNALMRHARQYLFACKNCELEKCEPLVKRCGYLSEATGQLCSTRYKNKRYTISDRTDLEQNLLAWESPGRRGNGAVVQFQSPQYMIDWQIKGLPPIHNTGDCGFLDPEIYGNLIPENQIITENLQRSFSGICLAGRRSGKESTRQFYSDIKFQFNESELNLPKLLTVTGWAEDTKLSRMMYFNPRTGKFDHPISTTPDLVIADGDTVFLNAISRNEFQQSNIIGVIHRIVDRDRLEAIGNRLMDLRQWYEEDQEQHDQVSNRPKGIEVFSLKRVR